MNTERKSFFFGQAEAVLLLCVSRHNLLVLLVANTGMKGTRQICYSDLPLSKHFLESNNPFDS